MRSTLSQVIASALRVDWSRLEGLAALRCAVGVATPLLLGLAIDQPLVGVFGAAGAFGVGFGSFQGAYRSRAGLMLLAAAGVAFSVFVGSLAGHSSTATVAVAASGRSPAVCSWPSGTAPRSWDSNRSWPC